MFETLLIKTIRNILSCFDDPGSEFPLTYYCEFIDEAKMRRIQANIQGREQRDCLEYTHHCIFIRSTNPITQPRRDDDMISRPPKAVPAMKARTSSRRT